MKKLFYVLAVIIVVCCFTISCEKEDDFTVKEKKVSVAISKDEVEVPDIP